MSTIILPCGMSIDEYTNILYGHYIETLKDIGVNTDEYFDLKDVGINNCIRQDRSNPRMIHLNHLAPVTYGYRESVCIVVTITGLRLDGFDMIVLYKKQRIDFLPYG